MPVYLFHVVVCRESNYMIYLLCMVFCNIEIDSDVLAIILISCLSIVLFLRCLLCKYVYLQIYIFSSHLRRH